MKQVITISREFGTGARTIGQKLAEELGFAYYDRAIIQLAAEKSGLSPDFIAKNEEKVEKELADALIAYAENANN